jgi:hypothetical protein
LNLDHLSGASHSGAVAAIERLIVPAHMLKRFDPTVGKALG